MKTLKRIIVIAVLILIAFTVSYLIYTSKNVASKNHAFCEAYSICENFRLGGVNARNYELFALNYCEQRGGASESHEISQAQNSREICELNSGVQVNA